MKKQLLMLSLLAFSVLNAQYSTVSGTVSEYMNSMEPMPYHETAPADSIQSAENIAKGGRYPKRTTQTQPTTNITSIKAMETLGRTR